MLFFEIKITNSDGEWGIICEKLGLLGQHDSMENAMDSFQAAIDLMADKFEHDDRQVVFDVENQRFHFGNTVLMLPFIFGQLRKRSGKSFTQIQKELGLSSTGAVHKYFNTGNKTAPNVQKFLDLIEAMGGDVVIR
jgi:hypothetical protein